MMPVLIIAINHIYCETKHMWVLFKIGNDPLNKKNIPFFSLMCITNHMCSLKSTGDPRPKRPRIGVRKNGFNPRDLDVKLAYQRLG